MNKNLITLDMDTHLIPTFESIHKKSLEVCKEVGAVLDLATSDVALYLYAPNIQAAQKVADVYGTLAVLEMKRDFQNARRPNLDWFSIECTAEFYKKQKIKSQ